MILSPLYKVIRNFSSLTSLAGELRNHYGLRATFSSYAGEKILHITRSPEMTPTTPAGDAAELVIINKAMKIITIGTPRVHPLDTNNTQINFDNLHSIVKIEKIYKGTKVIVSRDESRGLIQPIVCTEKDPHGCDLMPNSSLSVHALFTYLIERSDVNIVRMFSDTHQYTHFSYEFMIVQKPHMPPDSKLSYELFLLNIINKLSMVKLPEIRLDYIADNMDIRRPKRDFVDSIEETEELFRNWTLSDPRTKGVILTDSGTNQATILTKKERQRYGYTKSPCRHNLLKIVELIMKGEEKTALVFEPRLRIMVNVMKRSFTKMMKDVENLHENYGKARTRKHLALKISDHKLAIVLFALNSQKIKTISNTSDVLRPQYLLKLIKIHERNRFDGALNLCRGALCQKKL